MKSALQTLIAEQQGVVYNTSNSRVAKVRQRQLELGLDPCFMTQKRMLCDEINCTWRSECRRRVAVWKR